MRNENPFIIQLDPLLVLAGENFIIFILCFKLSFVQFRRESSWTASLSPSNPNHFFFYCEYCSSFAIYFASPKTVHSLNFEVFAGKMEGKLFTTK